MGKNHIHLSHFMRKPLFGVSDQVRKQTDLYKKLQTMAIERLAISDLGSREIVLSM